MQIFYAVIPGRPSGGSPDGVGYPQRRHPALRPQTRHCGAHQRRGGAAAGGGERGAGLTAAVFPFGKVMGGRAAHRFSKQNDKRIHT